MVDLGCQDTDWVDGRDGDVLEVTLLRDGFILANLCVDKGKYGNLGCISGWFGTLREAPKSIDGWLRVSGYRRSRWTRRRHFRCSFTAGWLHGRNSQF